MPSVLIQAALALWAATASAPGGTAALVRAAGAAAGVEMPPRAAVPVAGRVRYSLDDGWRYRAGGDAFAQGPLLPDSSWERVTLPHTWNAQDPFDDTPGYRRGIGWYRRTLQLDPALRRKRVFLYFEGANQVADVYVNGAFAGEHRGGYTAFAVDITKFVSFGDTANLVAVKVDNSQDPSIPPLSVGYALYGGIYRDVWLVATDPVHVDVNDHAGAGVYVSTPEVSADRARVEARAVLVNDGSDAAAARVVTTVLDPDGGVVRRVQREAALSSGVPDTVTTIVDSIARPRLWSPESPALYTVRTEIYIGDRLADRVDQPLGFRWYRFDPQRGFFLNGQRLQLRGTTRHQDFQGIGSALSNEQHVHDMQLIKAMGANFVRLAHYPQVPAVLDAADRLGLLIWQEVPVVNYITPTPRFEDTARDMLRDMIRQDYDHPSIIVWGLMNEVFLWSPEGARIGRQTDTTYMRQVRDFAASMNAVAHAEDPTRVTAMALHQSGDYDRAGVAAVPDIVGLNLYSGWYGGKFADFGATLDRRHREHPDQPFIVSEYGAGDDGRVNSLEPERFDHSGQWQQAFHESYLRQIAQRPFLAGAAIWNEFDFSQPGVGGPLPNMNVKGMATWDRHPKDVYYLYQANWTTGAASPMVHIATHDWTRRAGLGAAAGTGAPGRPVTQPVTVYSNLARVELTLNGRSLGTKVPDDVHTATWQVPFTSGSNTLDARGKSSGGAAADHVTVDFTVVPAQLRDAPFHDLAVNVGARTQVADPDGPIWVEDQAYRTGSYGYVGGSARLVNRDVPITGTRLTPLFYSYREGLTAYRADVPDGTYDVEVDLLEPNPDARPGQRVFDIVANGERIVQGLDLAARYGAVRAATLRFRVNVASGEGLRVELPASTGEAVLCGVRITRR